MRKLVFYGAVSVDNYLADSKHSVEWLDSINQLLATAPDDDIIKNSYPNFIKDVTTVIMGRTTYSDVINMDFEYPYCNLVNIVLTNEPHNYHDDNIDYFVNYQQLLALIPTLEGKIWIVGGEQLLTLLLQAQLIDEIILTQMPLLLGSGVNVFGNFPKTNLTLKSVVTSLGIVESHYEVNK